MTTCARCGDNGCRSDGSRGLSIADDVYDIVDCRDRELANLHSLIRSVTRRLENARELLDGKGEERDVFAAAAEIDAVLEALS